MKVKKGTITVHNVCVLVVAKPDAPCLYTIAIQFLTVRHVKTSMFRMPFL